MMMPVDGPITQWPNPGHVAWDIACRRGEQVVATVPGRMTTRWNGRLGNIVEIDGPEGRALYAHLQTVGEPKVVAAGEVIGTCGSTGSWSTGPHVHYELKPL